ncbi:UNVERIFIED_CONTAM: hypothetical protein GTU68_029817 [Idotea baltica]|nr:hypothetical protein [Idotea baltica]
MKMHGLGNDFVVIDARAGNLRLQDSTIVAIADRHRGVGFDQLAVMNPDDTADVALTFYNADGSTAGACGNATRCIARHIMDETGKTDITLITDRGTLFARDAGDGLTSVNMGHPQLTWDSVPLARDVDLDALPIDGAPVATGMGNPHCTFFVENAEAVNLDILGPQIEHHPLYPSARQCTGRFNVDAKDIFACESGNGGGLTLASEILFHARAVAACIATKGSQAAKCQSI